MIDIGANLADKTFRHDIDAVLQRARLAGVEHILVTGTSVQASREAVSLAGRHPSFLSATAGVHPHHADEVADDWIDRLRRLADDTRVVALGEMGLDYFRNLSDRAAQRRVFAAQLDLAVELGMPAFVHDRDSNGEVLELLLAHKPPNCVVHCFTGSARDLDAYLAAGFYIGITGWVCDERRGGELRALVDRIPLDRLLIETDAPYLLPRTISPRPRSRRNEPAYLSYVAEAIAAARQMPLDELQQATAINARRLFQLDHPDQVGG